jgi:hypothetical protein
MTRSAGQRAPAFLLSNAFINLLPVGFEVTNAAFTVTGDAPTPVPGRTRDSLCSRTSAWSPDARWIAFSSARGGFKDEMARGGGGQPVTVVFVTRTDGSDVHRLTDDAAEEGTVTFASK